MNPQKAAQKILDDTTAECERDDDGCGIEHACWMLQGIAQGYVQHEKAHRWLGYAQGVLVMSDTYTLGDMKKANKEAND